MKSGLVSLSFVLLLIPFFIGDVDALQQAGGTAKFELIPGESDIFVWGLRSDNQAETITISLSAVGDGSEFLTFQKSISIDPQAVIYVPITVTIPDDYLGGIELKPRMYATEVGEDGGAARINIRMVKTITLTILPNAGTEINLDAEAIKDEQQQTSSNMDPEPSTETVDEQQQTSSNMDPEPSTETVDEQQQTSSNMDPEPSTETVDESSVTYEKWVRRSSPTTITMEAEIVGYTETVDESSVTYEQQWVRQSSPTTITLEAEIVDSNGEFTAAAQSIPVDNQNILTSEDEYELSALIEENQRLKKVIIVLNEQIDYLNQLIQSIQSLVDGTIFS